MNIRDRIVNSDFPFLSLQTGKGDILMRWAQVSSWMFLSDNMQYFTSPQYCTNNSTQHIGIAKSLEEYKQNQSPNPTLKKPNSSPPMTTKIKPTYKSAVQGRVLKDFSIQDSIFLKFRQKGCRKAKIFNRIIAWFGL